MRIGELASKVGVSTHVLRAWESRYGLLRPQRSAGGYRLYGHEDERRVREVIALRDQGVSAAEASRRVLEADRSGLSAIDDDIDDDATNASGSSFAAGHRRAGGRAGAVGTASGMGVDTSVPLRSDPPALVAQLLDAVSTLDEDRAHAVLDVAFGERSVDSAIIDVLLPLFVRVGELWELGRIGIAQEHFASSLVRRRLGAMSLTWGVGSGPVAVLACPPGEFHDIVLLSFGVLLGRTGWRIRYLGPDTPVHSLAAAARLTQADAVVLACRRPSGFRAHSTALRRLGEDYPVWLAGRGATPRVLEEVGVRHLGADLVGAVAELTATARDRRNQREATARPDGDGIPVDDSRANGNGIQGDGIRTDGIQGDGIRTDGIQGDGIRTDATTPTSATA
ncbi:MerR family transcriptional regulator [Ornithinibacter sp.]|uniref:MerR family transcriptional regulator n=1 Tax=Ornithinibacter sp. TaxID=2862748 RepID=UPI002C632590|nr:MerR family transcriptional regulator [Ornithinibacter sp.]HRA27839.1 MerR family transcriptional regulator [Ornithinibacter sp.]